MAFDVVTAKQGKPHVTADQQALMQAGMLGKGRYALDALNNLACTMTDSNTLTVDTGGLMVDGRWVVNEAQTSFAIANGSQAQFRKDLAVLEITVDPSTGVTSLEEKVLQGATAATEDAAADPTYEAGDLYTGLTAVVPIARITLNGLTPTCTALLPSVADLKTISEQTKKLGDSVSQTKTFYFNSPCMTARGSSKAPVQLNVCGNVCTLYVNGVTTRTINEYTELVDSDGLAKIGEYLPAEFDCEQQRNIKGENKPVGCRLCGGSDTHLWLIKDSNLGDGSEMRFVFTWVR